MYQQANISVGSIQGSTIEEKASNVKGMITISQRRMQALKTELALEEEKYNQAVERYKELYRQHELSQLKDVVGSNKATKKEKIEELFRRGNSPEIILHLLKEITSKEYINKVLDEYIKANKLPPKKKQVEYKREQVLSRLLAGIKVSEVAKDLGVSRQNIYKIKEEFFEEYKTRTNPRLI